MTYIVKHYLDLIGSVPQPNGGVSQHVWRLAMQMAPYGCRVLDLYPAAVKYATPGVLHRSSPRPWLLKAAWLNGKLRNTPATVVHTHFSTPRAFAFGKCWMPRQRGGQLRLLTLHHGNLLNYHLRMNLFSRRLAAASIRSFDRVIVLSRLQHQFYTETIGVPVERLMFAGSFIQLPREIMGRVSARRAPERSVGEVTFVSAGGCTPYYRHEEAIRVVDRVRTQADARLTICLYGARNDVGYLRRVEALAAERPHVTLQYDLDLLEFIPILAAADVFLRPNSVDSYGLAVGDAITLGVPAVASDVCERYPGTVLFPNGDFDAFQQTVARVVSELSAHRSRIAHQPIVDSLATLLRAYELPALAETEHESGRQLRRAA